MSDIELVNNIEQNLFIQICKFGLKKLNGFKVNELFSELNIVEGTWQFDIVKLHCQFAIQTGNVTYLANQQFAVSPNLDSIFQIISEVGMISNRSSDINSHTYILKANFVFDYLDFLEFKEVSKNAQDSMQKATSAMWISIVSFLVSAFISVGACNKSSNYSETQIDLANKQIQFSKDPITIDTTQINQFLIAIDSAKLEMNKNIKRIENRLEKAQKTKK